MYCYNVSFHIRLLSGFHFYRIESSLHENIVTHVHVLIHTYAHILVHTDSSGNGIHVSFLFIQAFKKRERREWLGNIQSGRSFLRRYID